MASRITEQTTTTTTTTPNLGRNAAYGQDYSSSNPSYSSTAPATQGFNTSNPNFNSSNRTSSYRDNDYNDSRHHGRWTASGESRDLENTRFGGRTSSDRDFNRDRDYDRDYDRNYDRSRGDYDNYNQSGSSRIPVPPPMPPRGYMSGYDSSYGNAGYGSQFGSSVGHPGYHSLGMPYENQPGFYGSQFGSSGLGSSLGSGFGGQHYGSGLGSSYGTGYGSGFGGHHYGSQFPQHYGSGFGGQHYGSGFGGQHFGSGFGGQHYGSGFGGLGSRSIGSTGYGSALGGYGSQYGMGSSGFGSQYGRPEVDIYEVGNDYIIEVDLPGHSRDHIDTKLYGNELVITSKPPRRSHNFHINERSLGSNDISRRLYLPPDAQSQNINASLTNGVLKLLIPRNMTTGNTSSTSSLNPTGTSVALGNTQLGQSGLTTQPTTTLIKDTVTTTTETKRV